ncbi:MAG: hypothetical protein RL358_1511 [Pseudomonadota bacterium]|jgi:DNA relaxase NicK
MSDNYLPITNTSNRMSGDRAASAVRGRSGGAHSPHVVIRGETLPPKNPVLHAAHIDWLAFTLTPPQEVAEAPINWLLPQLFSLLNIPPVSCVSTGKGWNGYTTRVNLGENSEYGLIAYGGEKQRGTIHVELNATACAHVVDWQIVQQWGETSGAKITRVDLAHDDLKADIVSIAIARAWYDAGEFTNSGRPPDAHLIDDMGSGKGKTLYIGARSNGKMLRVYEKGRQLGDVSSPWVRVELELRNKSRILPWDILTSPSTYLAGGYPCLAYLSTVQDKIRTITTSVQITLGSILRYLSTVGGKSINVLLQANGGDAFALVNAIKRDGIPRRLVNYADFLPSIFYGAEVMT